MTPESSLNDFLDSILEGSVDLSKVVSVLQVHKAGEFLVRDSFARHREELLAESTPFEWAKRRERIVEMTNEATNAIEDGLISNDTPRIIDGELREEIDAAYREYLEEWERTMEADVFLNGTVKTDATMNFSHYVRMKIVTTLKESVGEKPRLKDIDLSTLSTLVPQKTGWDSLSLELTGKDLLSVLKEESKNVREAIIQIVTDAIWAKPHDNQLVKALEREQQTNPAAYYGSSVQGVLGDWLKSVLPTEE